MRNALEHGRGGQSIENEYTVSQQKLTLQTTVTDQRKCYRPGHKELCHVFQGRVCFVTCIVYSVMATFPAIYLGFEELF